MSRVLKDIEEATYWEGMLYSDRFRFVESVRRPKDRFRYITFVEGKFRYITSLHLL